MGKANQNEKQKATIPAIDDNCPYTSRLSARSALYTDLSLLLESQQEALESDNYRRLVVERNLLSRTSLSSRKKIWSELKKRYILDSKNKLFLAFWGEWQQCQTDHERALTVYCFFSLNDKLVAELSQNLLYPLLKKAPAEISVQDILAFLEHSSKNHAEIKGWTDTTKLRLARHYLASIRDFGLAKGKYKKTTIRPALYGAPVRLLIRALRLKEIRNAEIIKSPVFRLLAIGPDGVISALSELNRKGDILFKIQGDVIEMNLER